MKTILSLVLLFSVISIQAQVKEFHIQPDAKEGKDALVSSLFPEKNYATYNRMGPKAWTNSGSQNIFRAFIDFNLDSVEDIEIDKIDYVSLYLFANTESDGHDPQTGPTDGWVFLVKEDWDEEWLSWSSMPEVYKVDSAYFQGTSNPYENIAIDVTSLMKQALEQGEFHGLMFRLDFEYQYRRLELCSSDGPSASKRPTLVFGVLQDATVNIDDSENFESEISLNVFPNPMEGELNLEFPWIPDMVEIYDAAGKLLTELPRQQTFSVSIDHLEAGVYFLRLQHSGQMWNRKLVKM